SLSHSEGRRLGSAFRRSGEASALSVFGQRKEAILAQRFDTCWNFCSLPFAQRKEATLVQRFNTCWSFCSLPFAQRRGGLGRGAFVRAIGGNRRSHHGIGCPRQSKNPPDCAGAAASIS